MREPDFQAEIAALRKENGALKAQSLLLENFVAMLRAPMKDDMLCASLQQTLTLSLELTGAEKGSIFLLDGNGAVTDSILTRDASGEEKTALVGQVMDKGLAGWVLKHRIYGIVDDADNDSRWLSMENQPYQVGSALAVPIKRRGAFFGLLTLLHSGKQHFNQAIAESMMVTADQIALVLENIKLYVELAEAKASAELYSSILARELEKGRKIQRGFLPRNLPRLPNMEIAAFFSPALQVSGDFYDAFILPGGHVCLVIGDVSDKGAAAAFYMALIRSCIRIFAVQCCERALAALGESVSECGAPTVRRSILKALDITSDYLAQEHGAEGMFATVFFGVLDPKGGALSYINAGHLPVYVLGGKSGFMELSATGPALGLHGAAPYEPRELRIHSGSLVFGYTDGVTEALSPDGEMFGRQRLKRLVESAGRPSADELIQHIHSGLFSFMNGAGQSDDIAMLAVYWESRGAPPAPDWSGPLKKDVSADAICALGFNPCVVHF
ncbi:PP2C family protein-serine/threonine phosphatase [Desulfatibacillum alkenivorans]|jgi:sigma-B regulation protein RsbU (phosphoserine phosphatase)|nr:GAF domain-containing SpoIIE family protein phosphatase [Desulfatibacillum alkenivorans]